MPEEVVLWESSPSVTSDLQIGPTSVSPRITYVGPVYVGSRGTCSFGSAEDATRTSTAKDGKVCIPSVP